MKIHLQKAEMNELVAATGLWKYRCDTLKREVMDPVKGMGDKIDWDTYYPEGRSPLDDVSAPTERPRQEFQNFVEERPQPVQRSTIDRILENLNKGQDVQPVLTTTVPSRKIPTPRFRGRTIVEELVGELADSRKLLNPTLVYDRQEEQWTYPDFFTPSYIQHA